MDVFISWSGHRSKAAAEALHRSIELAADAMLGSWTVGESIDDGPRTSGHGSSASRPRRTRAKPRNNEGRARRMPGRTEKERT
jgi:hypothetical protein